MNNGSNTYSSTAQSFPRTNDSYIYMYFSSQRFYLKRLAIQKAIDIINWFSLVNQTHATQTELHHVEVFFMNRFFLTNQAHAFIGRSVHKQMDLFSKSNTYSSFKVSRMILMNNVEFIVCLLQTWMTPQIKGCIFWATELLCCKKGQVKA